MAVSINKITEKEYFYVLKEIWNGLLDEANNDVFMRFQWFSYIIESVSDINLFVLTAAENSGISVIAPLRKIKKILKYSFLKIPVFAIEFILSPFATFCDFINTGDNNSALSDTVHEIFSSKKWDVAFFPRIPENSNTPHILKKALISKKKKFLIRISSQCPIVKTSLPWNDYLASQSKNFREMVRKLKKKMERMNNPKIQFYESIGDTEKFLELLLKICENSDIGKKYYVSDEIRQKQLRNLLSVATDNKWLRAWVLISDERPIAAEVCLFSGNMLHCVFKMHDKNYNAYSPGSCLTRNILQYSLDLGYEYDFGPGDIEYKLVWTKDLLKTVEIMVFNDKIKSLIIYYLYTAKERLKQMVFKKRSPVSIYGHRAMTGI
jgi:hypothetical protein